MATPLLGFRRVKDREPHEHEAHAKALGHMIRHFLPVPAMAKGDKLLLPDFHKDPRVVADRGFVYTRIHQWSGSCVWAGATSALAATLSAARCSNDPVKSSMMFTLHNYAMSRHYMGSDRKGDGSMGSTFAKSLTVDGVRDWDNNDSDLPKYRERGDDGIDVSDQNVEYDWSTITNPGVNKVLQSSRAHLLGSAAQANNSQDIKALVLNGYGCSFACDNFIGNGQQQSDGTVLGYWDHSGGHQQYVVGYWEHPTLGPLYLVGNNWPKETYPITPMQPVCFVWCTEAHIDSAIRNLSAEVYGFSHLDWFKPQPELLGYVW